MEEVKFRIDVHGGPGQREVLVTADRVLDVPTASFPLDPDSPQWRRHQERLRRQQTSDQFFREIGTELFEAILPQQLRISYEINYQYARDDPDHRVLRIQLRLLSEAIADLPWECLFHPVTKTWLAANPHTPLSRYVDAQAPPPMKLRPPLRLLIAAAEPTTMPSVGAHHEVAALREAVGPLLRDGLVSAKILAHATRTTLRQAMEGFSPHLFHFVGHGRRIGRTTGLVLETAGGDDELLPAETLRELLDQSGQVRAVVLNACDTGGCALALARAGIAAIGMRDKVRSEATVPFCRSFYEAVASLTPLDIAANRARFATKVECGGDHRDWSMPAIYLPAGRANLFEIERAVRVVRVSSNPPRAAIYLDQKATGKVTPDSLVLHDRHAHDVHVVREGHSPSPAQRLAAGAAEPVHLEFQLAAAPGFLAISTPDPGARITACRHGDDQVVRLGEMGSLGRLGPIRLQAGQYQITAVWPAKPPHAAATATRDVTIRQGATTHVRMLPQAKPAPYADENVQFTVYRPNTVQPEKWYPLLAFAHLSKLPPDAPPDEPDPVEEVQNQVRIVLGVLADDYQDLTQDSRQAVPREGEITFVPEIPGIRFNPPRRTFLWLESVHREDFRLLASAEMDGRTARGRLSVYLGSILLADVDLAIRVDSESQMASKSAPMEAVFGHPYRRIFASYSHKDCGIVEEYERFVETLGDRYLRDCRELRAGEIWDERLMGMIQEADIFQLFWSSHSMHSPFVRQEWEYALALNRSNFVRPTYWEEPLPECTEDGLPPDELRRLQFKQIHWTRREPTAAKRTGEGSPQTSAVRTYVDLAPNGPRTSDGEPQASAEAWRRDTTDVGVLDGTMAPPGTGDNIVIGKLRAPGRLWEVLMTTQGWYISSGGHETGPFATEVVMEMIRVGQLRDDDTISTDRTVWVTVADYRAAMPGMAGDEVVTQAPPARTPAEGADVTSGATPATGKRRERIVVLGRRAAGKTVYLATLYARLWKSLADLSMTSISGPAHRDTMRLVYSLTRGEWPAATLDSTPMAIEVNYKRRKRLMVSMDYSGEVFRHAFVGGAAASTPETRELLDHLDNAGAVMLLLDPRVAYEHSKDIDAAVDDDFGMVQAVRRIREAPGGHEVPVALVLTKMDQNLDLIKKEGGAANFVRNHWPALARTLKHLVIFMVSALQVTPDEQGRLVPKPDSHPINLENPVKYCLKEMGKADDVRHQIEMIANQEKPQQLQIEMAAEEDLKRKLFWATVIACILLCVALVVAAIIVFF